MIRGQLTRDLELSQLEPSVPGEVIEYIYLPSQGFMKGRLIKKGQVIRVIDLEGQQVFDGIIWDANNFDNVLNVMMTEVHNEKWNKWRPGDVLYSKYSEKLAIISEDTTDGTHGFVGAFCNEPMFRVKLGIPGIHNCWDNFVAAMAHYGFSHKDIDWSGCISFFMDFRFHPDGRFEICECHNKPGDYIDLMAEMDIIMAISCCPDYPFPTNAYNPTPMLAVIFNPDRDYQAKVNSLRK